MGNCCPKKDKNETASYKSVVDDEEAGKIPDPTCMNLIKTMGLESKLDGVVKRIGDFGVHLLSAKKISNDKDPYNLWIEIKQDA